jgi:hypothetical protein
VNVCLAWIVIVRNSLPFVFFFFPSSLIFSLTIRLGRDKGWKSRLWLNEFFWTWTWELSGKIDLRRLQLQEKYKYEPS